MHRMAKLSSGRGKRCDDPPVIRLRLMLRRPLRRIERRAAIRVQRFRGHAARQQLLHHRQLAAIRRPVQCIHAGAGAGAGLGIDPEVEPISCDLDVAQPARRGERFGQRRL